MGTTELKQDQISKAAEVLGRAFYDDPLQNYVLPETEDRRTLGPPMFERLLRFVHASGQVLTTTDVEAAALWLPPGKWEMSDEAAEASGFGELPEIVGEAAFTRFLGFFGAIEPYHHRDAHDDHWYLAVIGVDPPQQGRGLGRSLIQPVLAEADAADLPCYLETAQPKNVPFYVNQGFKVIVDEVEPVSQVRFWTFRREPGA